MRPSNKSAIMDSHPLPKTLGGCHLATKPREQSLLLTHRALRSPSLGGGEQRDQWEDIASPLRVPMHNEMRHTRKSLVVSEPTQVVDSRAFP